MRKNIGKIFKKALRWLESHLNLVILLIFVIIVLYATWLYYNFIYRPISAPPEVFYQKIEIKKPVFDRVVEHLNLREERILEAMGKEYPDIFR